MRTAPGRSAGERFVALDGMRGIAAYIVVLHHAFAQSMSGNPLQAGFLAVDFFFVLSGFVMSEAYDRRFREGLGFERFARARLRRLAPTMMIGVLLGAVSSYVTFHAIGATAMLVVLAAFFVPLLGAKIGIYPLDGVQWSLFFELAANAVHGGVLWRLGSRLLIVLAIVSFGLLALAAYAHGGVGVGDTSATFVLGFPRVGFSYLAGILLHRYRRGLRFPSLPFEVPAVALTVLILVVGAHGGWATETLVVLAMPLLVLAGSFATASLPKLYDYLGRISFPVYAIHVPILCLCAHLPGSYRIGVELLCVTAAAAFVELVIRRNPLRELGARFGRQPYLGMS